MQRKFSDSEFDAIMNIEGIHIPVERENGTRQVFEEIKAMSSLIQHTIDNSLEEPLYTILNYPSHFSVDADSSAASTV